MSKYMYLLCVLFSFFLLSCELSEKESSEIFSDFAIKDTSNVVRFRISDTENNSIVISREDNDIWMIENSHFKARTNNVNLILETFHRIKIKQDVPNKGLDNLLTSLSVRHKKVEIYTKGNNKPIKTWYIGNATQDHLGTYMLLQVGEDKSIKPFITHKPGVYGSLDVRFFTSWIDWRSSSVFSYYNPYNIKSISVDFNDNNQESYLVERNLDSTVSLIDVNKNKVTYFDSSAVKHYFTHYRKIHYNRIEVVTLGVRDSIFSLNCNNRIQLKDINNNIIDVEIWKIKMPNDYYDNNGLPLKWDPEHAYIRINSGEELLRIQYYSWGILLKPLSFYLPK